GQKLIESVKNDPLVKDVTKFGESFIGSLPGKIITGVAAAGAITGLAAGHKELPMQIPEIPLDSLHPGLRVKLTYKGPVDKPTEAMISFTLKEGGGKKKEKPKGDSYAAETARIAADQEAFRRNMTYAPGSAEARQQKFDQDMLNKAIQSRVGRLPTEG